MITPATATFSVVASGTPTPTYQWQSAPSGSSTFTAISGATSASYTTATTTTGMTGTQYRCVATNSAGSATSAVVTLTVLADVIAPTQPAAPQVAGNGGSTPMLSGSTEANATITVYNNGVLVGTTVASGSGAWSYTLSLSSGSHTITVTATDAAGNVSTSS
ncbi:MAG: Ig-like domain-containing protein, partial [Planctomycetota bacterium]